MIIHELSRILHDQWNWRDIVLELVREIIGEWKMTYNDYRSHDTPPAMFMRKLRVSGNIA